MDPRILRLPPEVFQRISLFVCLDTGQHLPITLRSLRLTSRHFSYQLASVPDTFYAAIIAHNYDTSAAYYRHMCLQQTAEHELKRRCKAFQVFRSKDIHHPCLSSALWVAFQLLLDDEGQNAVQCKWTGILEFVVDFVLNRLYEGADSNGGWPLASTMNTLAVAVLWLAASEDAISCESQVLQDQIMQCVAPYVFAPYQYPIVQEAAHRQSNIESISWRSGDLRLTSTDVSLLAIMVYFARQETKNPTAPPYLPQTRTEANLTGSVGPTVEDFNQFFEVWKTLHFQPSSSGFRHWDLNWDEHPLHRVPQISPSRLYPTIRSCYLPGSLEGTWQGSFLLPEYGCFQQWASQADRRPCMESLHQRGREPLYCSFREYHHRSLNPSPFADVGEGQLLSPLPKGFTLQHYATGGVELVDTRGVCRAFFEKHTPDNNPNSSEGAEPGPTLPVRDILLIGQTDEDRAAAWGECSFIGRVDMNTGLITFQRISAEYPGAPLIFHGYLVFGQNLVGRFHSAISVESSSAPGSYSGAFSLCKAP